MMKPHGENLIPEKLRVLISFLGPTVYITFQNIQNTTLCWVQTLLGAKKSS